MKVRLAILKEYFSCLLLEGRVDDAREKYPELTDEDFDYLVHNQPTGSNNKYLAWSSKQAEALLEDDPDRQALALVIQAIRLFDGNQQRLKKRDINQYENVSEIETAVKELGKSRGQKAAEVRADVDVIYNDDRFTVVRPHTAEASCKYGTGTKWCIASTSSHNYYSSYSTSNNKFYFIIDKTLLATDPASKFAIAYISDSQIQVYNAPDKLVSISVVAAHVGNKWNQIWEKIQSDVKAHPMTREVEEAQKATEEHIKNLLAGNKVSQQSLEKIARDGKLTTPVVQAIVKSYENYTGTGDYGDSRMNVISVLSGRISLVPHDTAMAMINWTISLRPTDTEAYWSGRYHLEEMMKRANLSSEDFRTLAKKGDETVLGQIMSNPNVPADLAVEIGEQAQQFKDTHAQRQVYYGLIKSDNITKEQFKDALQKHPSLVDLILSDPENVRLSSELIRLIPISNVNQLKAYMRLPNMSAADAADAIDRSWSRLDKRELYDILKTATIPVARLNSCGRTRDRTSGQRCFRTHRSGQSSPASLRSARTAHTALRLHTTP
jgi:hypothetical protein